MPTLIRITFMPDENIIEKYQRTLQAESITRYSKNFSFSFVVNQVLSKELNRRQYSEKYKEINELLSKPRNKNRRQ